MSNIPVIFRFLKDLTANNNREWFNEHREEYEIARLEFENFLSTVIARISLFDESIRGIQPKEFTYPYSVPDSLFLTPDILDKIEEVFRQFKRFADFTNFTIDDFE